MTNSFLVGLVYRGKADVPFWTPWVRRLFLATAFTPRIGRMVAVGWDPEVATMST